MSAHDPATGPQRARYSRLERYTGLTATLPRWQALHVAVVGCGGLGGGLILQLARLGVAQLTLIDRDIVGPENLGHQPLFTEAHATVGMPKALAAAEAVQAVNAAVTVHTHVAELNRRSLPELLAGVELLFDGLDNYFTRLLLNDHARSTATPLFHAGVVRGELSAKAVLPGTGSCLRCLLDRPPAPGEAPTCATAGVFPPLLGVANALQLELANRWLTGESDTALYSLSLPGWELRRADLPRRVDCPACNGRYEYLDGALDQLAASACSPDRAELDLPAALDLAALERRLAGSGLELRSNPYCLVASCHNLRYTLFASGKLVQEGSADPAALNAFAAEYIGL